MVKKSKKQFSKAFACSIVFLLLFSSSILLVNAQFREGTCKNPDGGNYCGKKSGVLISGKPNCFCDNACTNAKDCCTDYKDVCLISGAGGGAFCGNGIIDNGETCDGNNFGGYTCKSFGGKGDLICNNCKIGTSSCITTLPSCGNGIIEQGELCDGNSFGAISKCTDYPQFVGGTLKCSFSCLIDTSSCVSSSTYQCSDSDGGINIYQKGTAKSNAPEPYYKEVTDKCIGSEDVEEAQCHSDGIIGVSNYHCENGCKDGACIKSTETLTTDLYLKNVRKGNFNPYGFYINVCMNGPKSINDLKKENPKIIAFPYEAILYDKNGNQYQNDYGGGASGDIEDIKNGQCLEFGTTLEKDQVYYDQTKKVKFVLDLSNIIPESNENNNDFVFTESTNEKCTDTDKGIDDYFNKGIVYDLKFPEGLIDFCKDANILFEYGCYYFDSHDKWPSGKYGSAMEFKCPNGCKDGACILKQSCANENQQCGGFSGIKCCGDLTCANENAEGGICAKEITAKYLILKDIGTNKLVNINSYPISDYNIKFDDYFAQYSNGKLSSGSVVSVFESRAKLFELLNKKFSVVQYEKQTIDGNLVYVIKQKQGKGLEIITWTRKNLIVTLDASSTDSSVENTKISGKATESSNIKPTPSVPKDILSAYLQKYPSDLDKGIQPICGNNICEEGENECVGYTNSIPPVCIKKCPQDCKTQENSCYDSDGGNDYYNQGSVVGFNYGQYYNYSDYCADYDSIVEFSCNGAIATKNAVYCGNVYNCQNGACKKIETNGKITVLSPNGGENWYTGNYYTIEWKSVDVPLDGPNKQVSLSLINKNNGQETSIAVELPRTGKYYWNVPATIQNGNYVIHAEYFFAFTTKTIFDESDAPFKIISTNPKITKQDVIDYINNNC